VPHPVDIQKMLNNLSLWNAQIWAAAVSLGADVSRVTWSVHSFHVAGTPYFGWMTGDQYNVLKGHVGSKSDFQNTLIKLVVFIDQQTAAAQNGVVAALGPPSNLPGASGTNPPTTQTTLGCCDCGDAPVSSVTKRSCCGILQGTRWNSANDCSFPSQTTETC
jgi:hypothetical protein